MPINRTHSEGFSNPNLPTFVSLRSDLDTCTKWKLKQFIACCVCNGDPMAEGDMPFLDYVLGHHATGRPDCLDSRFVQ
jgi:hypothetical protein